jgi:hypothetical protein
MTPSISHEHGGSIVHIAASTLVRRFGARAAVVALAIGAAVLGVQSPSMADDNYLSRCSASSVSCQTGVKVSGPNTNFCEADTYWNTTVCIDFTGDIVYVRDGLADYNSALARILSEGGTVRERFCRNPHGDGTWARCNFDWVESVTKYVDGGVRLDSDLFDVYPLWDFANA